MLKNGSSWFIATLLLWNVAIRFLLHVHLSSNILHCSLELPEAPKQVSEVLQNQIHLQLWAQDVCCLLLEKKPCLGCKLNTEHDQKARDASKRDNGTRDNSFADQ
jgi:hypothetical protein